jgi:membrane-anchored glycerophosphoryl diester phosphodiesterase (GDPDase)
MQAFSRGWLFLKQAWVMAFKDKDLLKPSFYALIVGMIISVIGIVPIVGAAILLGDSTVGRIIMGIMGAIMVFVQFVVTYIFSAMTVHLIYGHLAEGDGRMDHAWAIVRRDFLDLLMLAAASTFVNLLRSAAQRNRRGGIGAGIARGATSLLQVLWTEASYLVLPAMVIDDLNLKDGMARILKITKENLLLIGISTVGVRLVNGLIGFVLGFGGFILALAIGGGAVYLTGGMNAVSIIAIAVAVLVFFTIVMVTSVINSYTSTAYHTCLYLWARGAEKAQTAGQPIQVAAPAPLAAVLG